VFCDSRKLNKTLHKFKHSQGEVIKVQKITDRNNTTAKNYGIYFRYRNRTGQINAFKEFRAASLEHAISALCKYSDSQRFSKTDFYGRSDCSRT
jgi:hypothetical protein